jgi:hypothetical protein
MQHSAGLLIDFLHDFTLCLDEHFGYIKNASTTPEPPAQYAGTLNL